MTLIDLIAKALVRAKRFSETQEQRRGVERAEGALAEAFLTIDPQFDRARFFRDCVCKSPVPSSRREDTTL